jgi:Amt family ammonium transporter
VFILWFLLVLLHGAAATSAWDAARIIGTTTIAAAYAAIVTMCFTWLKNGKPDVSMTLTAHWRPRCQHGGLRYVDASALRFGSCGIVVVHAVEFIDQRSGWTIRWAPSPYTACAAPTAPFWSASSTLERGLFYAAEPIFGVQALGVFSDMAWWPYQEHWFLLIKTTSVCAYRQEEIDGLDISGSIREQLADFMFDGMPDIVPRDRLPVTAPRRRQSVPVFVDIQAANPMPRCR